MWIENVSYADIKGGTYPDPGDNAMLIQIVDPCVDFPIPPRDDFKITAQFEFSDVDNPDDEVWPFRMSDEQGKEIARHLRLAMENNMNVIVHCIAGICRSGAVVEVAKMIGFDGGNAYRQPNVHVKRLLMREFDDYGLVPNYDEIFKVV
jgi:predicted protein tyrosine phosphatase